MDNIPSLDELLSYGEDYQYPDLIMSDYFREDNRIPPPQPKQKQTNPQSQPVKNTSQSENSQNQSNQSDESSQASNNYEEPSESNQSDETINKDTAQEPREESSQDESSQASNNYEEPSESNQSDETINKDTAQEPREESSQDESSQASNNYEEQSESNQSDETINQDTTQEPREESSQDESSQASNNYEEQSESNQSDETINQDTAQEPREESSQDEPDKRPPLNDQINGQEEKLPKTKKQNSDNSSNLEHHEQKSSKESYEDPEELSQEETPPENSQEQKTSEESNTNPKEQQQEETPQESSQEQKTSEESNTNPKEQPQEETPQESSQEQKTSEESNTNPKEQPQEEASQENPQEQKTSEESNKNSKEHLPEDTTQENPQEKDDNDFDDLMDNYDNDINRDPSNSTQSSGKASPSDKLNDISTTKVYQVLKKLVSLSYEKYQKGTYKYDKKEIVKHYLTNQKFRIIDDLVSPTFKPDVYVFDLSPSNNESLEMYVNAISSIAIKNSLIYLTYNEQILRKLEIKKSNSKGIDVNKIANSDNKRYNTLNCTIFDEYRSLYQELREIKDRKIYVFSDFDISSEISKLSQENKEIVWFSTEKSNYGQSLYQGFFYREYPTSYEGYYVETSDIEDIEKYIKEKNKNKYKKKVI